MPLTTRNTGGPECQGQPNEHKNDPAEPRYGENPRHLVPLLWSAAVALTRTYGLAARMNSSLANL